MRIISTAVSALVIAGMGTGGAVAATSTNQALTATIASATSAGGADHSGDRRPINFAPGAVSATVPGGLAGQPRTYVFRASAGQEAQVGFAGDKRDFSQQFGLLGPDGRRLEQSSAGQYPLPEDGEYTLQTFNDTQIPFDLTLTIPAS